MLAECQTPEWPNDKVKNPDLYVCLHGYEYNVKIPLKKNTMNAKRSRNGTAILPPNLTSRYTKHKYAYDGFFYNQESDAAFVKQLKDCDIMIQQLIPFQTFSNYMKLLRDWHQQINIEMKSTNNDWYCYGSEKLWVRLYAKCVGTTPFNDLPSAQQTEITDRFFTTVRHRMLYVGVSNLLNAGLGLFARSSLSKGTVLGAFRGQWYPKHQVDSGMVPNALAWTIEHLNGRDIFVPDPHCILNTANDSSKKDTKLLPNNGAKDKGKKELNAECVLAGLDRKTLELRLSNDIEG